MVLKLGEGNVNGEITLILDTTVVISLEIKSEVDEAIKALDRAHDVIRKMFMDVTKKITSKMQPED